MENLTFNEWEEFSSHCKYITLSEIIDKIGNGYYQNDIEEIRNEYDLNGKSDLYKKLKNQLPSFTISGRFSTIGRKSQNLEEYYGIMVLDLDNIGSEEKCQIICNKLTENPYTKVLFRSPSNKGFKIIVETDNKDFKKHTNLYKKLVKYFESVLGVEFDNSTCDVNRLCFYSYDPNIYYNENSNIFSFSDEESNDIITDDDVFLIKMEEMIKFTSNKQKYEVGNRNNFLKLLSSNCSNHGILESEVLGFCLEKYVEEDFDEYEITTIIEKSYKTNKHSFGNWENRLKKIINIHIEDKQIVETPKPKVKEITFEDDVFQQYYDELSKTFPKKYTTFVKNLKTEREKDIVILTMMTVLNSIYRVE